MKHHQTLTIPFSQLGCLDMFPTATLNLRFERWKNSGPLFGSLFLAAILAGIVLTLWFGPGATASGVALALWVQLWRLAMLQKIDLVTSDWHGARQNFGRCVGAAVAVSCLVGLVSLVERFGLAPLATALSVSVVLAAGCVFVASSYVRLMSGQPLSVGGYGPGGLIVFSGDVLPKLLMPWHTVEAVTNFAHAALIQNGTGDDVVLGVVTGINPKVKKPSGIRLSMVATQLARCTTELSECLQGIRHQKDSHIEGARVAIGDLRRRLTERFENETGLNAEFRLLRASDMELLPGIDPTHATTKSSAAW
jgi:hypothetical protein